MLHGDQVGFLFGLLLVVFSAGMLTVLSRRLPSRLVDQLLALGIVAWTVFLVWKPRFADHMPGRQDEFIEHMALQVCIAVACRLMLEGTRAVRRTLPIWLGQLAAGAGLLLLWITGGNGQWYTAWILANAAFALCLLLRVAARRSPWRSRDEARIFVFSTLLLISTIAAEFWSDAASAPVLAALFTYPAALIGLWKVTTLRSGEEPRHAQPSQSEAAERERQRIAQEVHDGVGSQLVALLSSLDPRDPQQQALALGLERCLLELKITVDSLHTTTPPGLLEGLGTLRHRLQPSLTRMGVELHWHVEPHECIEQLRPLTVTHALRVAQEAVANALRHAQARHLTVGCYFDETRCGVVLDIRDDGTGMLPRELGSNRGRGLAGMTRRAEEAGIRLEIDAAPERGCAVRLLIPVDPASARQVGEAGAAPHGPKPSGSDSLRQRKGKPVAAA
ncbi:ATP-binding protein [Ramlibacter sp. AN1015]|uniref:sensor histidine kinase n=1 Tax=Ramlibacter sp. AN1015 TaxID=3133428 RepID=UPI0030BF2065